MTENDKIKRVQVLLQGDARATDDIVAAYLAMARDAVMNTRFPYGYDEDTEFPIQFEPVQCELAARYFARAGALGEITHNENGINRSWASEDDSDLLKRIPPLAKVVSNASSGAE